VHVLHQGLNFPLNCEESHKTNLGSRIATRLVNRGR